MRRVQRSITHSWFWIQNQDQDQDQKQKLLWSQLSFLVEDLSVLVLVDEQA